MPSGRHGTKLERTDFIVVDSFCYLLAFKTKLQHEREFELSEIDTSAFVFTIRQRTKSEVK
jgi:hypothetical protein